MVRITPALLLLAPLVVAQPASQAPSLHSVTNAMTQTTGSPTDSSYSQILSSLTATGSSSTMMSSGSASTSPAASTPASDGISVRFDALRGLEFAAVLFAGVLTGGALLL